ncbi:MAG: hypothetical protein OXI26_09745 [bacterium]|nr:hypothetical protein [bacterium]
MYIIDDRTGAVVRTVSSTEEAQLALRRDTGGRLERALRNIFDCEHPDDAFRDDRDKDERESRTVRTLARETPVLGVALRPPGSADTRRRWHPWELRWDMFTERDVLDWPRSISELRGEAALAEASIAELAAHLNTSLRGDMAEVLRAGARYIDEEDAGSGDRGGDEPATAWDRFRSASGLYELSLEEAAEAIAAGAVAWEALDEWSPSGGVDGDPYGVCRFGWGPLRARVRLTAAELLAVYLAGDADLTLYRGVYDYGDGPTEFIWPHQGRVCCGFEIGARGDRAAPIRVHDWGSPHVSVSEAWGCCRICGTSYPGALLTRRRLEDGETATLGVTETLDGLPQATLAAIARHGADALACDLQ